MNYYTIDRQNTAKLLNISTRTLDRYSSKKIFSTKKINGKIFFHKKEIEDFLNNQNIEQVDINIDTKSKLLRQVQNFYQEEQNTNRNMSKTSSTSIKYDKEYMLAKSNHEASVYKKMYETIQNVFEAQQERLQQSYTRIGTLENHIKNLETSTISLTEAQETKVKQIKQLNDLKSTSVLLENENALLQKEVDFFSASKNIYMFISIFIIVIFSVIFALI